MVFLYYTRRKILFKVRVYPNFSLLLVMYMCKWHMTTLEGSCDSSTDKLQN